MDWPAELTACLPPLRSDEPPELRRRIALELADHWHCALQRELTKNGGDLERATQQAARRVGDLRAIARRLWFEAMWEKIMLQRILVGTSVLAAALACAAVGILWSAVRQTNAATAELRDELQRGLADLTTVLREQQSTSSSSRIPNTNDAVLTSLKLVDDTGATVPRLDDLRVAVSRLNEGSVVDTNPRTPRAGVIPLGRLAPGEYSARITDSVTGVRCRLSFVVQPSLAPLEVVIPCPNPQRVTPEVQINWPPSFIEHQLGLLVECQRSADTVELPPEDADSHKLVIATTWLPTKNRCLLQFRPGDVCIKYEIPDYNYTIAEKPGDRSWLTFHSDQHELLPDELTFLDGDWQFTVTGIVLGGPNHKGKVPAILLAKTLQVGSRFRLSPGEAPPVVNLGIPPLLLEQVESRIAAGALETDL